MELDEDGKEWLRRANEGSSEKIKRSHVFASLMTSDYLKDPLCALQLGLAILMNKPLCLIVIDDTPIPPALEKLAFAIERIQAPEEMADAMKRIMAKADELGIPG